MNTRIRVALGLAVAVLGTGLTTGTASAHASEQRRDPVTRWLEQRAQALKGVEPTASDADLAPLGRAASRARIVGLGEAETAWPRSPPSSTGRCATWSSTRASARSPGRRIGASAPRSTTTSWAGATIATPWWGS